MAESFLHHLNIMDLLPGALVALRHGPSHSRSFPLTCSGGGSIDEKMISYQVSKQNVNGLRGMRDAERTCNFSSPKAGPSQ